MSLTAQWYSGSALLPLLSRDDGTLVGARSLALLAEHQLTDVEVHVRESLLVRQNGPKLMKPVFWSNAATAAQEPLTTTLGIPIYVAPGTWLLKDIAEHGIEEPNVIAGPELTSLCIVDRQSAGRKTAKNDRKVINDSLLVVPRPAKAANSRQAPQLGSRVSLRINDRGQMSNAHLRKSREKAMVKAKAVKIITKGRISEF
ncbi:hypothetical protein DFH08DRAFT_798712 [Mycena albidolilacea]|uniref:Uncharacterized protein n=1 Tax=Mycena albidolilacea TaxID=1033008 RepID=A0AAD7F460_9AGAR|nr:hypothetical protein DFH08DRAFT_798712 [Mycena albidolilacea]